MFSLELIVFIVIVIIMLIIYEPYIMATMRQLQITSYIGTDIDDF